MGIILFLLAALGIGFIIHHQGTKSTEADTAFFNSEYPILK